MSAEVLHREVDEHVGKPRHLRAGQVTLGSVATTPSSCVAATRRASVVGSCDCDLVHWPAGSAAVSRVVPTSWYPIP